MDGEVCAAEGTFAVSAGFVSVGEVELWVQLEIFRVDAEQPGAVA